MYKKHTVEGAKYILKTIFGSPTVSPGRGAALKDLKELFSSSDEEDLDPSNPWMTENKDPSVTKPAVKANATSTSTIGKPQSSSTPFDLQRSKRLSSRKRTPLVGQRKSPLVGKLEKEPSIADGGDSFVDEPMISQSDDEAAGAGPAASTSASEKQSGISTPRQRRQQQREEKRKAPPEDDTKMDVPERRPAPTKPAKSVKNPSNVSKKWQQEFVSSETDEGESEEIPVGRSNKLLALVSASTKSGKAKKTKASARKGRKWSPDRHEKENGMDVMDGGEEKSEDEEEEVAGRKCGQLTTPRRGRKAGRLPPAISSKDKKKEGSLPAAKKGVKKSKGVSKKRQQESNDDDKAEPKQLAKVRKGKAPGKKLFPTESKARKRPTDHSIAEKDEEEMLEDIGLGTPTSFTGSVLSPKKRPKLACSSQSPIAPPQKHPKQRLQTPLALGRKSLFVTDEDFDGLEVHSKKRRGLTDASQENVRRGTRHRSRPLAYWKLENPVYTLNESGPEFLGITAPVNESVFLPKKKPKKQANGKAVGRPRGRKVPVIKDDSDEEESDIELMSHDEIKDQYNLEDLTVSTGVVIDREQREVLVDVIRHPQSLVLKNVHGNDPEPDDPVVMTRIFNEPGASCGVLTVRKGCEKPHAAVRRSALLFHVKKGNLVVSIHRSSYLAKRGTTFFVPVGNSYHLKNIGQEDADIFFVQFKEHSDND
eukprot:m.21315 g.21315  ORF g.21315 m.21315 type:complete len:706 (+) comp28159_c0_seq1:124-2241(+)